MNTNTPYRKKNRWPWLGPGTIVALVVAIAVAVAGRFARQPQSPVDASAGRLVYQADSQGHLRKVTTPTGNEADSKPLWKPEPGFLLDYAVGLKLSPQQLKEIETQNGSWLLEKARLKQMISRAASGSTAWLTAKAGQNQTAAQITDNLNVFSQLSREYDDRRTNYWVQSLSLLTDEQQESLQKIEVDARRAK